MQAYRYEVNNGKVIFSVFPEYCKGCGLCREKCAEHALSWSDKLCFMGTPTVVPDPERCKGCLTCEVVCPDCAIRVERLAKRESSEKACQN